MTGIYKIINKINGKMYIGSAVDIQKRWIKHKSDLRKNKHHSKKLQNSWNKYGEQNFIFEIVEECEKNKDLLLSKESYYFILYDTVKNGYNCAIKAGSPMFGKKHSEETKKKISKSNKGKKRTEEFKQKLSIAHKGKILSESTKEKIRLGNTGKGMSDYNRKKVSERTAKPILQYDLDDNFIKEWKTVTEAKKYYKGDIPATLKGRQKQSCGFKWKYK